MNAWNECIGTIERLSAVVWPLQEPDRAHNYLHPDFAGYMHLCQPFAKKPMHCDAALLALSAQGALSEHQKNRIDGKVFSRMVRRTTFYRKER